MFLYSLLSLTIHSVKAILDANRNSLMLLDLKFSILTLAITAGTFVAALYGIKQIDEIARRLEALEARGRT